MATASRVRPRITGVLASRLHAVWLAFSLLLGSMQASAREAALWRNDPVHSQILFFVDHLGFSQSIGRFRSWQAELRFDPQRWEQGQVQVRIASDSIDLGEPAWNRTMCGKAWLDCGRHPQIVFVSQGMERVDAHSALLHGRLELLGQSQPVVLELRVNKIGTHPLTLRRTAGFSASTRIRRSDFGMRRSLGQVGDEIEIRIELEAQLAEPVSRRPRTGKG